MIVVSLERAMHHLRAPEGDEAEVEEKLGDAVAVIADYLKGQADDAWTEETAPGPVKSATLLMLTHLYENRGDDMKADEEVWSAIRRLLMRLRDPALA